MNLDGLHDVKIQFNKERCIVAQVWMEHHRTMAILEDPDCKHYMGDFIKEKKAKMDYLEKKYPWLKGIIKILSSKTPCPIGEWEL